MVQILFSSISDIPLVKEGKNGAIAASEADLIKSRRFMFCYIKYLSKYY